MTEDQKKQRDQLLDRIDTGKSAIIHYTKGWLALDVELTPELILEGYTNDMIHMVNAWRKDLGLPIGSRIYASYELADDDFYTEIAAYRIPSVLLQIPEATMFEMGEGLYNRRCYVMPNDGRYDEYILNNNLQ